MKSRDLNINKIKELLANRYKAIYRSSITLDGTVKTLKTDLDAIEAAELGFPVAAELFVISTDATNIVARFTLEGTDPVATTTGAPLYNKTDKLIEEFYNLQRFKVTREDAADTTSIEIIYYKEAN